jgi:hypothetical protein
LQATRYKGRIEMIAQPAIAGRRTVAEKIQVSIPQTIAESTGKTTARRISSSEVNFLAASAAALA